MRAWRLAAVLAAVCAVPAAAVAAAPPLWHALFRPAATLAPPRLVDGDSVDRIDPATGAVTAARSILARGVGATGGSAFRGAEMAPGSQIG